MALLLGLAMLPAGAIATQVGLNGVAARQAAYEEQLSRQALQSISVERSVIDETREMLRVLATAPAIQQIQAGDCRQWLGDVALRYPYVAALSVMDLDGRVLCSFPHAPANFIAPASELRERAKVRDGFTAGFLERGPLTGQPVLSALEPIHDDARLAGFVSASITTAQLREILDRGRELDHARAAIVDSHGRIIAQSSERGGERDVGLPRTHQILDHLGPNPHFVRVDNGAAVIVPLHAPDIYVVMAWASDQPVWRRWGQLAFSLGAPILIWLLAVTAGWFAIEVFVARPLSSVEAAARSFARGEDKPDPPELRNAPDEIRSLRRTLAAMAKTLRGRELRLIEALAEERALLREVHHRVKNNLQMVASLLNIQARNARDESEAWGLARAHDRVQLLALVHQRIYASGEVRELQVDDLAAEITHQLIQSRGLQAKDVNLALHLDPARADVDRAVPLAFLIGEGVSAALDSLGESGPVSLEIHMREDADGSVRLAVDAPGAGHVAVEPSSGGRLIEAFARQLGAQVGRDSNRPYLLWAVVPPSPHAHATQQHARG